MKTKTAIKTESARNLEELISHLEMAKKDFAEEVGITAQLVSNILHNKAPLTPTVARLIYDRFPNECNIGWLLGDNKYRTDAEWECAVKSSIPEGLKDWDETEAAENLLTAAGFWLEPSEDNSAGTSQAEDSELMNVIASSIAGYRELPECDDKTGNTDWHYDTNCVARCTCAEWDDIKQEIIEFAKFKVHLLIQKRGVDNG